MYPRDVVVFLLGMTGLLVTMSQEKSKRNVIKPVGPKMCARLCSEMAGCSSYIFEVQQLSCQLTEIDSIRPDREKGTYLLKVQKNKIREAVEAKLKCEMNAKIYHTRRNNLHCSRIWHRSRNEGRRSRILMMPVQRDMEWNVLHPENNFLEPYPHISFDYNFLQAIAYISSSRMIVIATDEKLWFFLFDNAKKPITREIHCEGLSVDNSRQLLFCTAFGRVSVMSTEGDNIKSIAKIRGRVGSVVCDPKRSEIYVVSYDAVNRYTYTGDFRGSIAQINAFFGLCIDTEKDVLYFLQATIINKFDLSTNRTKRIADLNVPFMWLFVLKNTLYLTRVRSGEIVTVNTESGNKEVIKPDFDMNGIIMCAIP